MKPVEPEDREAEWYRRKRADKDRVPLPPEFRLYDDEDSIEVRFPVVFRLIRQSPRDRRARFFTFGLIVFLALLALFVGEVALVVLVLATVLVIWLPLALLRSLRRTITIRPEGVEVGWWPVPFLSRRLVSRQITQAFVVRRGAPIDVFPGDSDDTATPEFDLHIVRPDGSRERLVGSLQSVDHALFLERWIERRLGIEDAPVAGEFS